MVCQLGREGLLSRQHGRYPLLGPSLPPLKSSCSSQLPLTLARKLSLGAGSCVERQVRARCSLETHAKVTQCGQVAPSVNRHRSSRAYRVAVALRPCTCISLHILFILHQCSFFVLVIHRIQRLVHVYFAWGPPGWGTPPPLSVMLRTRTKYSLSNSDWHAAGLSLCELPMSRGQRQRHAACAPYSFPSRGCV